MRKLVYLTFKEEPSGVYYGQVADVVRLWREEGIDAHLVSMVWPTVVNEVREKLARRIPESTVLPIRGGRNDWRRNRLRLAWALARIGSFAVVARSPLAANLALDCRALHLVKKVCYDGRAAAAAELEEYSSGHDLELSMPMIERRAVQKADYRIAVSQALVNHWSEQYAYDSGEHCVIPCSSNNGFEKVDLQRGRCKRQELGFDDDDVVFVYAGGGQGWQSPDLLQGVIHSLIMRSEKNKALVLSKGDFAEGLRERFPDRVAVRWVEAETVPEFMAAGDYGLLVREPTMTNRVAAPVKFAEYLSCGLPVICSSCVGDYPRFVLEHRAGHVLGTRVDDLPDLVPVALLEKQRLQYLSAEWFGKKGQRTRNKYRSVAKQIGCDPMRRTQIQSK